MSALYCWSMMMLAGSIVASPAGTIFNVYTSGELCRGVTEKQPAANELVAFSVGRKAAFSPAKTAVIPMDHVFYNDGGYFDMKTSFFTAPVSGVYAFYFGAGGEKKMHVLLYVTNKDKSVNVATTYDYNGVSYNQASSSVYTKLKKGDRASLWCSVGHEITPHNPPSTYFTGQLMKQLD